MKSRIKPFFEFLKFHPTRHWFWIFFLVNLLFAQAGGSNAEVRFATLCAMAEDHSFQIDSYKHISVDWSRTPDGHYYSSKAPGPILLAFPLFWVLDSVITLGKPTRELRDRARIQFRGMTMPILSFFLCALPFSILAAYWLSRLDRADASPLAVQVTATALLFGNTTSFFMNSLFNHALVATLLLVIVALFEQRKFLWVGFFFGWVVLSDYSGSLLLFPLLLCLLWIRARIKDLLSIGVGGIVPFCLFAWYHWVCFGGPFVLAYRYVNPEFLEPSNALWGVLSVPHPEIWLQFLFGFSRGLLWTQPWMLFVVLGGFVFLKKSVPPSGLLFRFFYPGFWIVVLMFSCYGKWWHGGDSPGPRFISCVFPGLAVLFGFFFDQLNGHKRIGAVTSVAFAVLFFITVFGILAPPGDAGPIWSWYFRKYFQDVRWVYWARLVILLVTFGVGFSRSRAMLSKAHKC